jgi:palmitoyltransferase
MRPSSRRFATGKKHGRIVAKFDHYCYMIGNSVGELNHGLFYRLVFVQVVSIWMGVWLCEHAFLGFTSTMLWSVANIPLIIMNLVSWLVGIPMSILLCIHTFNALTSSTTYEFMKLEKLE